MIPRRFLATSPFQSAAYALLLPLMSYMFSAAKKYNNPEGEGRAELILTWMVLVETNRIVTVPIKSWGLWKSAEQLLRLAWGIVSYKAKKSYLIGNNPQLIHNYVKKKMLGNDLRTTPMNSCDYIVMGEQNHEIDDSINGYSLGKIKDNSEGMLTIGRVFQLNLPKADTCISLALAKMLRRRFTKIPVDEARCIKARDFVLEGLIGDIGGYRDTQRNSNDGEGKSMERVFRIIREELTIVSEYLHVRCPTYYYFPWYAALFIFGILLVLADGIYLIHITGKWSSAWVSHRGVEAFNQCSFHSRRADDSEVVKVISRFDKIITIALITMGIFMVFFDLDYTEDDYSILFNLRSVEKYLENPANRKRSYSSKAPSENELPKAQGENADSVSENQVPKAQGQDADSVSENELPKAQGENAGSVSENELPKEQGENADSVSENELPKAQGENADSVSENELPKEQGENADSVSENELPKAQGENALRATERIMRSSEILEVSTPYHPKWLAIKYFRLRYGLMEPSPQQNSDPNQETAPQQNNNPFTKEAALSLSSYCHYLVSYYPELLPDGVKWTKKMYGNVKKDILSIPWSSDRSKDVLEATWDESPVVKNGVKLAKELRNCAKEGTQVWTMLAHFWAEMMLFIAPSDNVEGHEKILQQKELITQLWALLTHAGIITRPKPTEHQADQSESNEITGADNV
ncbi:hypothetical protein FCM35_KLT09583 [Carex littledalei]|uniref:DUF4220 domain-containing protein n=1 Tax=Carex littledalei TaxID=544730 RepID=A0A833W281_9POAL|nr:hypothetical protein FCM35_KLT09583 [Carex littledalei]